MADRDARPSEKADEFYVGYLPMPPGYRLFLRFVLPAILWLMVAIASVIAPWMRDAGPALWDSSERAEFVGTLDVTPYPVLRQGSHEPKQAAAFPSDYLLVEAGKLGGRAGLEAFQGKRVRVAGSVLRRDGRAMIELAPGAGAVQQVDEAPPATVSRTVVGRTTLRGEIVDSKCYLGAMRPGDGKTHRACAQLCIAGGIPPMLVTHDAAGNDSYYLLVAHDGSAAGELIRPFVAEPVEVSGQLERLDDLLLLRVDPAGISRL